MCVCIYHVNGVLGRQRWLTERVNFVPTFFILYNYW